MKKIFNQLLLILYLPIRVAKKSKIDNFVFGLIVGALFSLVVNVVTVRIQEEVGKQRALEAVEREITFHTIVAKNLVQAELAASDIEDSELLGQEFVIGTRYDTKIWDSNMATPYIFELDPSIASQIETYYSVIIGNTNRLMGNNEEVYKELGRECSYPFQYQQGIQGSVLDFDFIESCNEVQRKALSAQNLYTDLVFENANAILEDFHPAQDRIDSWWMSILLGDKAYEIVKVQPDL